MQPNNSPHLVAYKLCPYVQRSVIVLEEKGIPYQRTNIDLANKPDWFKQLSPTGKVPLLILSDDKRGDNSESQTILFESAVICEYLNEITESSLLATSPLDKAYQRAWIEFATSLLNQISKLYHATSEQEFETVQKTLARQFGQVENELKKNQGDYFNGEDFSLVDAAFAPVFRYFDVFEQYINMTYLDELGLISQWRKQLAKRPAVQKAVSEDYFQELVEFIKRKKSYLGSKMYN